MENKLDITRNIISIYGVILMIIFLKYNLDTHADEYNFLQKLIIILLPLLVSSLFWNWESYSYLNEAAYTTDDIFLKTYLNTTRFLTLVLFLFDAGMTYGIWLKLEGS